MTSVHAPANLARQFNQAARQLHRSSSELLSAMQSGAETNDVPWIHDLLGSSIASVMLQAFSLELILKALRMKHKVKAKKNHGLLELFSGLPPREKAAATSAYASKISTYNTSNECSFSSSLETLLSQYARAFEEWRYMFEYKPKQASIGELQMVFEVFR